MLAIGHRLHDLTSISTAQTHTLFTMIIGDPQEMLSGLIVALASIPTSIAFANIAGLNPMVSETRTHSNHSEPRSLPIPTKHHDLLAGRHLVLCRTGNGLSHRRRLSWSYLWCRRRRCRAFGPSHRLPRSWPGRPHDASGGRAPDDGRGAQVGKID